MAFKWNDENTPQVLNFMSASGEQRLNSIETKQLVKMQYKKTVHVPEFPKLNVKKVKLKKKKIVLGMLLGYLR